MVNLTLIGTVHEDFRGPERLEKMLKHLGPKTLCLEATQKTASIDSKRHQKLMEQFAQTPYHLKYSPEQVERARAFLNNWGYEVWIPKQYKNGSSNVRLYCLGIDVNQALQEMDLRGNMWIAQQLASGKPIESLELPKEIDFKEFVEGGSLDDYQRGIDLAYDETSVNRQKTIFGGGVFNLLATERDKHFASKIRDIVIETPDVSVVAILGNMHLYGDYNNTYNMLTDLNPSRVKLKEADVL